MNSSEYRINLIKQRIESALNPSYLHVEDESAEHEGHEGALASGGGHFKVEVISSMFSEKPAIERHRMIYLALGDAIGSEIHAIKIAAKTPNEASNEAEASQAE